MSSRLFRFVGGAIGKWQVTHMQTVIGTPLQPATYVDVFEEALLDETRLEESRNNKLKPGQEEVAWVLRGVTSYTRYVNKGEQQLLTAIQPALARPQATCAALIPLKKSALWWGLSQDERRAIFEERSHHIQTGIDYLPAVARRLHHAYDLGEPFDFLTWFEYAPEDAEVFEQLTRRLRDTEEWQYVEREIDIRLVRVGL